MRVFARHFRPAAVGPFAAKLTRVAALAAAILVPAACEEVVDDGAHPPDAFVPETPHALAATVWDAALPDPDPGPDADFAATDGGLGQEKAGAVADVGGDVAALALSPTGDGYLLAYVADRDTRAVLTTVPLDVHGNPLAPPRPVASDLADTRQLLLAWDWSTDTLLAVTEDAAGLRAQRLDKRGAPRGESLTLTRAPEGHGVSAIRRPHGFEVAFLAAPDTVVLTKIPADVSSGQVPTRHVMAAPGATAVTLADDGEARAIVYADVAARLFYRRADRVDTPRALPFSGQTPRLLADGDGLVLIVDLPLTPDVAELSATRLSNDGTSASRSPHTVVKATSSEAWRATLRPRGGLGLLWRSPDPEGTLLLGRFDAAGHPEGAPDVLPLEAIPVPAVAFRREGGLACGLGPDKGGATWAIRCHVVRP